MCAFLPLSLSLRTALQGGFLVTLETPCIRACYFGEELVLATEESNLLDRHAVAVLKNGEKAGQMPNKLVEVLKSSGSIKAAAC